ncbi:hypothetical protein MHYP_G00214410 [Metynnis hypsauchen]
MQTKRKECSAEREWQMEDEREPGDWRLAVLEELRDIFSDHHPPNPTVFRFISGTRCDVSRALSPRGVESGVHQGTAFLGFAPLLDQYIPWNASPRWMRQSALVSEASPASRAPTLPGSQSRALRDGQSG